ncbi:MAG: hypothetical protein ACFFD4_00405 [Candidatus Odinarchaeota archaeon]
MTMVLDGLYERLWENKKNRTVIFSTTLMLLFLFIELYFLMFPEQEIRKLFDVLYLPLEIQGVTTTPLLDVLHVILWVIIFFFFIITYGFAKESITGLRMSVIDVTVSGAIFAVIVLLIMGKYTVVLPIYAFLITALYAGIIALIFLYMFISLRE